MCKLLKDDQESHIETDVDFGKIIEKYCETDEENVNTEDKLEGQHGENEDKEDQIEKRDQENIYGPSTSKILKTNLCGVYKLSYIFIFVQVFKKMYLNFDLKLFCSRKKQIEKGS